MPLLFVPLHQKYEDTKMSRIALLTISSNLATQLTSFISLFPPSNCQKFILMRNTKLNSFLTFFLALSFPAYLVGLKNYPNR